MFDPLVDKQLHQGQPRPETFWAQTPVSDESRFNQGELDQHISTDVVIIGGGYTGLSCAYHLAGHSVESVVLEANSTGWGCSGRNAGFVLSGSGRLSLPQYQKRWGDEVAQKVHREFRSAIDTVEHLIRSGNIQCSPTRAGYLKLAHKPQLIEGLQQQAAYLKNTFGDPVTYVHAEEIRQHYLQSQSVYGGLYYPYSFGLNPLQLAQGYSGMVHEQGVKIYTHSPALSIEHRNGKVLISTPKGRVTANKLVLATNGYSVNALHPAIDRRHFPVLSSVMVTAPLTQTQLAECGIKPGLLVMDTRELKYYYRLLPDNRILFGGRGAIKGKNADHPVYKQRLLRALKANYPGLSELSADYYWSGWISVSLDDFPRICQFDRQIYYSMGYCGSGVSFATQAGKRLADAVAGVGAADLPFMQSPLAKFPFSPLRRTGLWAFYHWGRFKDHFL